MCRAGGGKGSPGMNPGPYRPLYMWGLHVGGCQTNRPLPRGGSSRPMVARLVRYGPVRQKITFLCILLHADAYDSYPPAGALCSKGSRASAQVALLVPEDN